MIKPRISVIIPTHKRTSYLFCELEQIFKQKDVSIEVIVVNDVDDEDDTDEILERFPSVVYIKNKLVQGPSQKHKAGYRIAKGDYLYMPDDDDYLIDELFFKKAIDILDKDRSLAFLSGHVLLSYEKEYGVIIKEQLQTLNFEGKVDGKLYLNGFQSIYAKPASTVSTLFRKQAFDEMNAIEMIEMSDSSMYIMALIWGDAFIFPDVVAKYRIKSNSLTTTASVPFLFNVLRQKEHFLIIGRDRIHDPKNFWKTHFITTCSILITSKNKKTDKFKVLWWGVFNNKGSLLLLRYILLAFGRVIIQTTRK